MFKLKIKQYKQLRDHLSKLIIIVIFFFFLIENPNRNFPGPCSEGPTGI
jgi:hypothetical protein